MTYTVIVKRKNKPNIIRKGLDKLNSIIIPAELKLAFPKAFKSGYMSVEVKPE